MRINGDGIRTKSFNISGGIKLFMQYWMLWKQMLFITKHIKGINNAHNIATIFQITQVIGILAPNVIIAISYLLIWRKWRKSAANLTNLGKI